MMRSRNVLAVISVVFLGACVAAPEVEERVSTTTLVYPPPPDPARFYFERSIAGSADIEIVDREVKWRRALTGEAIQTTGFSKPYDVEACEGTIFVSDTVSRRVYRLSVPTGEFSEIGLREPGQLRKPLGMATDEECNLYVADQTASRIVKYDAFGNFMDAYGGVDMFDRLSHVEVEPDGTRIYAVDTGGVRSERHHVRVIDTMSGKVLYDIGRRGVGDGELNLPRDIALSVDGLLYVVDTGNFRVQAFSRDGAFVTKMGSIGNRTGQFARPKGIDTDPDGNVYVSDASHGNFQIFDPAGQLLLFIGNRDAEAGPGAFMLPAGIAVDEDGRVYMADQYFQKIDIFRPASVGEGEGFLATRSFR